MSQDNRPSSVKDKIIALIPAYEPDELMIGVLKELKDAGIAAVVVIPAVERIKILCSWRQKAMRTCVGSTLIYDVLGDSIRSVTTGDNSRSPMKPSVTTTRGGGGKWSTMCF